MSRTYLEGFLDNLLLLFSSYNDRSLIDQFSNFYFYRCFFFRAITRCSFKLELFGVIFFFKCNRFHRSNSKLRVINVPKHSAEMQPFFYCSNSKLRVINVLKHSAQMQSFYLSKSKLRVINVLKRSAEMQSFLLFQF